MRKKTVSVNELPIRSLCRDSRHVVAGDLFIACRGQQASVPAYIPEAIAQGAVAALYEASSLENAAFPLEGDRQIPLIPFAHLSESLGFMAARFFEDPSRDLSVIGVTGTNGKTSISHFIAQVLGLLKQPCGLIGTLGIGPLTALVPSLYTTPDAIENQRILADFKQRALKTVAMEVSSHALDQHRVNGIHFHTGIFSNLSHDHLDYHGTLESYWAAKKKLWTELKPAVCIVNAEDSYGRDLLNDPTIPSRKIAYTTQSTVLPVSQAYEAVCLEDPIFDHAGMRAHIKTPWGEGLLETSLWGRFNLSNLLAALSAVCVQGMALKDVLSVLPRLQTVPGRMMRRGGQKGQPLVLIDYAHTPDGLLQVLGAVRMHCAGRLWVVVGCGGDRDRAKRPLMAGIAESHADQVILTQDNPRTEDPKAIMQAMIQGLKNPAHVMIEYDRRRAIQAALSQAGPKDLVVIAGKGHEDYQIIGTTRLSFSDSAVVQAYLEGLE